MDGVGAIRIFISHNKADITFATDLYRGLTAHGADVWYDHENLGLERIRPTIDAKLRSSKVFIVILTPNSLKSEWVSEETDWAYSLYRLDKTRIILPVVAEDIELFSLWLILHEFQRVEASDGKALPHDDAIRQTLIRLGLILEDHDNYPPNVADAITACYRDLGSATSVLGPPKPPNAADAREPHTSPRGTAGYKRRFMHGSIYWSERCGAQAVWGAIRGLYEKLNGRAGRLGFPASPVEKAVASPQGTEGIFQRFEHKWDYPDDIIQRLAGVRCGATVYWSKPFGAHAVWSAIGQAYERAHGTAEFLGFPTSDEETITASRDIMGWRQQFEGGEIYWSREHHEHRQGSIVQGEILAHYQSLGAHTSRLGFPVSDQWPAGESPYGTTGIYQRFEGPWTYPEDIPLGPSQVPYGATIYWSERFGAYSVTAGFGDVYERQHGTTGVFGFPITPEIPVDSHSVTEGVYQRFEGGNMYFCKEHRVKTVVGEMRSLYEQLGGATGELGFPIGEQEEIAGENNSTIVRQRFEGGQLVYRL